MEGFFQGQINTELTQSMDDTHQMTAPYHFDIRLHARPENASDGPTVTLASQAVETLTVPCDSQADLMRVSFDEGLERLANLPGCYVEPDGSIVWVGGEGDARWQVDGNLYERGGRVMFATLTGSCPPAVFDRLLGCFGWPEQKLMMELLRAAVFVSEEAFRRHASLV
jgi:hypothetical protein